MNEALVREIELLREFGYTHFEIRGGAPPPPAGSAAEGGGAPQSDLLADLQKIAVVCQNCRLAKSRTQVVYGVGSPNADLMFIGEAPGRDEDLQGEPFVGRAGQLLTDIITKGMGFRREDVYIANVVKCRPPENRNPEPDEVASCEPFLKQQIDLVRPEI